MIADNRLTEISVWDDRLLAEQLKKLSLWSSTSISRSPASIWVRSIYGSKGSRRNRKIAKTQLMFCPSQSGTDGNSLGDLWKAGEHLIYCASAREGRSFSALMQGRKGAMVFIDPPYNVRIDGNVSGLGSIHHREFAMASGEMNEAEFTDFLSRAFSLLADNTANGSVHFICMDWRHLAEILRARADRPTRNCSMYAYGPRRTQAWDPLPEPATS